MTKKKPTGPAGHEARAVIKKIDHLQTAIDDLKHGSPNAVGAKINDLSPEVFSADIMRDMKDVVGRMRRVRKEIDAKNDHHAGGQEKTAQQGDNKKKKTE